MWAPKQNLMKTTRNKKICASRLHAVRTQLAGAFGVPIGNTSKLWHILSCLGMFGSLLTFFLMMQEACVQLQTPRKGRFALLEALFT